MMRILSLCLLLCVGESAYSASQVEELFDKKDFIESPKISTVFWSDKENKLYGKSVIRWSEQDFAALEKKLIQQQVEEKAAYLESVEKNGYVSLDDTLKYERHNANLAMALRALPQIKVSAEIARAENGETIPESASQRGRAEAEAEAKPGQDLDPHNPDHYLEMQIESKPQDEELRYREYWDREQAKKAKKRKVLTYAALVVIGSILSVAGLIWFRFYRPRKMVCPKCRTSERGMITSSSPIKKGSGGNLFKVKVRRKYYCQACGYKWVQRTQ